MKDIFSHEGLKAPFLGFSRGASPSRNGVTIFGCPMDLTATYRPGVDNAPAEIRRSSDSIETYSPFLDLDLQDLDLVDLGDMRLGDQSPEGCVDRIHQCLRASFQEKERFLCLGGEHTVTLGICRALLDSYPDLVIIDADAHTDLRDHYEDQRINHATVMRRISELIGPDRIYQFGVRSGERSEFQWALENGTLCDPSEETLHDLSSILGQTPAHLSLDIDVMDPSCVAGVGNPEPGGWSYKEMQGFLKVIGRLNLVSADLVELNPDLDKSEVSSITAAKIAREITLILGSGQDRAPGA